MKFNIIKNIAYLLTILFIANTGFAKEIEYADEEISIRVSPGEPTQIKFPGIVAGGYKKTYSALSLEKKDGDLIIFANEKIDEIGEAIVVRLKDGRSYSVRLQKSTTESPRDDVIKIKDKRGSIISSENQEDSPEYKEKNFGYAPPTIVSGLMREIMLTSEFGKNKVTGYQVTEQYKGESVLNDGTLEAKIDKIYIGPNLWGYVLDVKNLLDISQKLNPATFRLDGTRAVSFKEWELAPRPLNIEEEIAAKDSTKAYIVTRAR